MKNHFVSLALLTAVLCGSAQADDAAIKASLKGVGVQHVEILPAPVAGLKTVLTENGVLYTTDDGRYMVQGPLYDVSGKQPVNITNRLLLDKLNKLEPEMIVYKAAQQKHVITVFTDITCGYCHKLHEQMKEYNDLGITVRYLAFPRQGLDSVTEKKMQAIWCVADRKKAFDDAMRGEAISPATCDTDIARHFELGVQFGVSGTPAIVLENGSMVPGYQPPKEMAAMLDAQKSAQN